jgi:hypothetical protein
MLHPLLNMETPSCMDTCVSLRYPANHQETNSSMLGSRKQISNFHIT